MLTWDQAQPGRHLPTSLNIVAIAQRRHKRSRAQGPNPFHLLQPLTRFHLVAEARELTRDLGNPGIQRTQLTLPGSAGGRVSGRITHCLPLLTRGAGACGGGQCPGE
jgi:hypothetical protein